MAAFNTKIVLCEGENRESLNRLGPVNLKTTLMSLNAPFLCRYLGPHKSEVKTGAGHESRTSQRVLKDQISHTKTTNVGFQAVEMLFFTPQQL